MADEPSLLKEDGYLNVEPNLKQIIYHPSLNVILICTDIEVVHVLDVNSGVVLQSSRLCAKENSKVTCKYLPGQDKVLFCDGYGIGVRSDYNGVLLLDTILQKPVATPKDVIKLELLLSEAILLKQNLLAMTQFVIEQLPEVITELCNKISEAQRQTKKGIKAQKWNTVCLDLPLELLKRVAEVTVSEFTLKNQHVPELAVAAAVQERLNELLNESAPGTDKSAMASEARRLDTFSRWPHMDYKWALPEQMAQAGFYHQPNNSGDDRAMCFTCNVCLVCWERTDEPWSEHERHSPNCPFVMGEYTQNVPLSVTYATAPALDATYRGQAVNLVGSSAVPHLVATATSDGLITVYDVAGKLRATHAFYVTQFDSPVLECCLREFGRGYSWMTRDEGRSLTLSALCVVGEPRTIGARTNRDDTDKSTTDDQQQQQIIATTTQSDANKVERVRPAVICGLTLRGWYQGSNQGSEAAYIEDVGPREPITCLCLALYDFQYTKDAERLPETVVKRNTSTTNPSNNTGGTTNNNTSSSTTTQLSTAAKQNILLSFMNELNCGVAGGDLAFINDVHYQAMQFIKQAEPHNYHNLIPGESDDIYLPPAMRLLVDEEPDAATTATANNYALLNGQVSDDGEPALTGAQLPNVTTTIAATNDKGISDHITELKSSKTKRLDYSHAVQCVPLPAAYKRQLDLEIVDVLPTRDSSHVLVVLRSISGQGSSALLLYPLSLVGPVVRLAETPSAIRDLPPSHCPLEVSVVVPVATGASIEAPSLEGSAVLVCADGAVRIYDLLTLKPSCVAKLDTDNFVSAVYCNSLERLCAATASGSLHFYALNDVDSELGDDHDDEQLLNAMSTSSPGATGNSSTVTDSWSSSSRPDGTMSDSGAINEYPLELTVSDLRYMHSLCAFEPTSASYCVVVPPCWSEMQQAQRQRRHPQYLSGDEQHTRTWRLQTDTTTWDEHMFELTLPAPATIGHMDVHFSLHGQHTNPPHVELTLLRQHTSGIGHRRAEVHFQVDETISFECLQRNQNPVTSREYLRSHNADILAGPIQLADCLDLTDQSGCVTLTSPKLFKASTRTLLLHIKALCDPSNEHHALRKRKSDTNNTAAPSSGGGGGGCGVGTNNTTSAGTATGTTGLEGTTSSCSSSSSTATNNSNKAEYYMGCDCLHELSITLYRARHADVSGERMQRTTMLESNQVLAALLRAPLNGASTQQQSLAFHVLLWVASIRLARNRGPGSEAPAHQLDCLRTIEPQLGALLQQCVLRAGRSIAHKCVKFIIVCSDGARNISESVGRQFDDKVFEALMHCLPEIGRMWSAGALHWLVVLLLRVSREHQHSTLATHCISLLSQLAQEMSSRANPYHLLLRTRFGLFGTPLEPELFDMEPPVPAKPTSVPLTYASVMTTGETNVHPQLHNSLALTEPPLDTKELLSAQPADWKLRLRAMAPTKHMRGLLETEPLHFTCIAASDGTRVERFDPNTPPVNVCGFYGSMPTNTAPQQSQHQQHSGTKKADADDMNVSLTDLDITPDTLNPTAIYEKEMTQLLLSADLHKGSHECWPILGNKIDGLAMTVDDIDPMNTADFLISNNSGGNTGNGGGGIVGGICGGVTLIGSGSSNGSGGSNGCKPSNNNASKAAVAAAAAAAAAAAWPRPSDHHMDMLSPQSGHCSLQQLLITPPQQVMVVERMQSGARRFVTLDFGAPVLLTDVLIPACHDLVSLSLDLWLRGEDIDAVRLVLATDIGTKTLVLSDLQPPPICRYIKITTIGRYGMSTTRCRIPIGHFYGHMIMVADEMIGVEAEPIIGPSDVDNQLNMLSMLLEDVNCRYSLACSRLKELLQPLLASDIPNTVHMTVYMGMVRDSLEQTGLPADTAKVLSAYQEATMYQRQLNVVHGFIRRIEGSLGLRTTGNNNNSNSCVTTCSITEACSDKVRALAESLLDIVLSVSVDVTIDRDTCEQLFQGLCVTQAPRLQMLTATLLVRTCGRQPFWGSFIADTLARMFSSGHTGLFPLDRVFVLLTYLGRRSPERALVLDATLRVLAEVVAPLARPQPALLASRADLSLLGWILLYLSMQLDGGAVGSKNDTPASRWGWLTADSSLRPNDATLCPTNPRRKLQRRFSQYKHQFENIDWTKKAVTTSTPVQALSALSSQAASLSTKLEAAFKQQESVFKRIKQYSKSKDLNMIKQEGSGASGSPKTGRSGGPAPEPDDGAITSLDPDHCLAVTRGLVSLLLTMDHSCSADMFLLACKVVGRLVTSARLSMWQLLTIEQLQQLMRTCVRSEQPWMQHALACLLQDLLDVASASTASSPAPTHTTDDTFVQTTNNTTDMDTDSQAPGPGPGPSWKPTNVAPELFEAYVVPHKFLISGKSNSNPLPSVYESDDSELDDFLDDILERGRSLLRRNGSNNKTAAAASAAAAAAAAAAGSISSAMDARLELGVDAGAETRLRRLTSLATGVLFQPAHQTATSPSQQPQQQQQQNQQQGGVGGRLEPPPWPETLIQPWALPASLPNSVRLSNHHMLAACFNSLFGEAHLQSATELEHTLRLWLTLNRTSAKGNFIPVAVAIVPLAAPAVASLVNALVRAPHLSLRAWCVALQALTLCCNLPAATSDWLDHSLAGMATSIVAHPDFVPMLLRLLAHTGLSPPTHHSLAGPPVCRALHDLLVRLMMRCDVVTPSSNAGVRLKEHLLRLVYQLVQPGGPLALRQGPLDVQCKFVQCLLNLDFADTNLAIVMCILESTGILVSSYVSNVERIQCVNLGERNGTAATNFSGLYASVLGNQTTKQDRPATWEALLIALLKLLTRLVQTPLPQDGTMTNASDAMDTETVQSAQTDESKAERKQEGSQEVPTRVPCLADNVLLHHASITRLCESLAACSGSSLTMIAGCAPPTGLADLDVPGTVGDAVFQLLSVMTHKTSKPELILQPLVQFLKSAKQLSEPLLWFILQVLNNEQALIGFLELDGVTVLAESMVRSTGSLSAVPHGTISLLMHHMASTPSVNTRSDPTISYAGTSLNKKMQQANMENAEALINFAPMASIRCHGNTTQSADVLIQSAVASHRRARTPQWCYHFSAEESYTDLSIRLPCAVLLREVQLQPHLSTLSTCPSAVALEVSNGSPDHLMPASPPLPTSGMTFIRLHLPLPEVVTHVLLRLYKPRDASNIGLSQIRLLGTSAFGGLAKSAPISDVCDEEAFSKFSLGWLRLLHHCFMVPVPDSALERRVVAAAARVPHLLVTCCGLLLVPTHIPPLYLPNLERVLCKLSLHDRDSGLAAIRMLLGSRAALCGATNALIASKSSTTTTHSVCELLHQVCEHQDPDTMHRVTEVLDWLGRSAAYALTHEPDSCSPAFVSCIASILWSAKEVGVSFSLDSLIQPELFQTVFTWSQLAGPQTALKAALDRLLCSLCYIRTSLFPVLLQRMSVLVPNLSTDHTASISDDRKDSESMTDDHKQDFENESEWYGRLIIGDLSQLNLSEEQLETIAMVSRSPPGIQQLLDSGLPKLLVRAILEFCTCNNGNSTRVPMARVESVTSILRFFGSVCVEQSMRDWLGSVDGAAFWLPLLQWLCQRPAGVRGGSRLRTEMRAQLEEACVRFLAMCCLCHRHNQRLLAKVLCDVIGQQQNGISGFLRRLVLQLLLENEKVLVCVKADETIYETSPLPQPAVPFHPSHKRTHDRALLLLGTNLTIRDILEQHISFATSLKPEVKSKETNSATAVATAAAAAVAAAAAAAATAAGGGACITQPPPPPPPSNSAHKTRWEFPIEDSDHISVAAGVTAKDKRVKDVKNQALSAAAAAAASSGSSSASSTSAAPQLKKKRFTVPEKGVRHYTDAYLAVRCEALPDQVLPHKLTLAQLLALLEGKPGQPDIHLTITHNRDDKTNRIENESLLEQRPIANTLQMFSSLGGLALLAQHLPTVYPEIVRPAAEKPSNSEQIDLDWVKVDGNDELYDDLEEIAGTSTPTKNYPVVANVPPHSLSAFGLFLRLPGYAEVLLKDSKKALCLLRLVLGVTDDGEGGDIFMSPVADSLPTLPFEVLRQLYDSTPLGTDDGRLLRTISINIGVTQLLLTCLAVFTHQVQPLHGVAPETNNQSNKDVAIITASSTRTDDKGQLYWAKGTGFGTGSTQQSWNVEQALLRQRSEEEHVTVLLQVLASYINPGGSASDELADSSVLPATFEQQLGASCLLAALSSYLRNDSVLDMARHIPLYGSVLQLLRAMALSQQLVALLLPRPGPDLSKPPSIVALLQKMKSCVDNYTCRLRFNKNSSKQFKFTKFTATEETDEPETDEGLALLMPDIQETAQLVQQATNQMLGSDDADTLSHARDALSVERPLQQSLEQRYLDIMRRLQFDTYEMICEVPDGYKFVVSYHFEGNVRSAGEQSQPARVKRLAQEAVTLATSLPLSYSSSVFVRCDTDRLDIMKVLITGPADTPYANGCFELDVYFPPDYPNAPMMINLETTGHHTVRFNPNLYNDGKVCLSVLNTWHGRPEEKWNAHTSSFLQVLVSIQSLILVPEPYFNEPGYERSRGTPSGTQSSREYNANIWQATVRWAMLEQIVNPCPCFKDVIHTHFWLKRHEVLAQVESWIADLEAQLAEKRATRTASKRNTLSNLDTFKKNFHQLRDQLAKLRPPDGIDDLSETTATPSTASVLTNASTTTTTNTATELDNDIEMEKLVSDVVE